jgi:hypothetical protein
MEVDVETTVLGPAADGATLMSQRFVDVRVIGNPAMDEAVRQSAAGVVYESAVTADGRTTENRVDVSDLEPTSRAVLDQLIPQLQAVTPFPEQPVGAGAKWRVTEQLTLGGAALTKQTDMRLVRSESNEVELVMRVTQTGARGPIKLPGVPAGVDVTVRSWRGTGKGTQTLDLTAPLFPVTSELTQQSRQRLVARQGGESQTLTVDTDLSASFASA